MAKMEEITKKVYGATSLIPKGRVTTYGRIAKKLELGSARLVGRALHTNRDPVKVPCHRVVFANGALSTGYAMGGLSEQVKKLKNEGIEIHGGKVNLKKYLFKFNT